MADADFTAEKVAVRRASQAADSLRATWNAPALPWLVPTTQRPAMPVPSSRRQRSVGVSEHDASASQTDESGFDFQRLSTGSRTMATAESQRAWRSRDPKRATEMRLSREALSRLDNLVARMGARGRGEAIERLLMADAREHPGTLLNEGLRLARAYLVSAGQREAALRDADGNLIVVRIEATNTLP